MSAPERVGAPTIVYVGAALALAVMLVVVVAVVSLAVNAQGPFQASGVPTARARPARPPSEPSHPPAAPSSGRQPEKEGRRPPRDRAARARDRRPGGTEAQAPVPEEPSEPVVPLADIKPLGGSAQAKVISVVDERTLGPVTRSRLTLQVEPEGAEAFEVTTRVAFPTPEHRARVKVGAILPVRYDVDDHRRVLVDMDRL